MTLDSPSKTGRPGLDEGFRRATRWRSATLTLWRSPATTFVGYKPIGIIYHFDRVVPDRGRKAGLGWLALSIRRRMGSAA